MNQNPLKNTYNLFDITGSCITMTQESSFCIYCLDFMWQIAQIRWVESLLFSNKLDKTQVKIKIAEKDYEKFVL